MRYHKLLVILIALFTGCEEKINEPLPTRDTGLLVVEGMLTNENRRHLVKLSLPYAKQNGVPQPATGAIVTITEDRLLFSLTEFPGGSGNYYTPTGRALTGKLYTLAISYNGKQYFAQDSPLPVQPLQRLEYRETDKGYTLTSHPHGDDPNYIEHFITWENTNACISEDSCVGAVVFYDLKTIDVNELYKPDKEPFYFPKQTRVVRRKYSVSPAYRNFLRSMLSETEWRGGVFDVQRDNVPTNLSEGAVGFFAVSSVVADSTIVE